MARTSSIANNYVGYSYAYPHKTAYKKLDNPYLLKQIWENENLNNLFLYFHIPFCSGRCCFCNLFTLAGPDSELITDYIRAIERQCRSWSDQFPEAKYSRMAIGGGTPTLLSLRNMERLFSIILSMGCDPGKTPGSVEMAPETCSMEKLQFLFLNGIQRISLGVQTFVKDELKSIGRRGSVAVIEKTLSHLHGIGFPAVNIDLIYGIESQSEESWLYSLNQAIQYMPEEIYIYPLYVQKLTQLADQYLPVSQHRTHLYRTGRDYLLNAGYEQNSMRMFSKKSSKEIKTPVYCCQEDGMVGFGAGARSYTKNFHYSSEYAVLPNETYKIINNYIQKQDFSVIDYGIELSLEEQQRRYIIKSILRCQGLDRDLYYARYNSDPMDDYGLLRQYEEEGLLRADPCRLYLTPEGIELSDYIGPSLYSNEIQARMSAYQWK